MILTDRELLLRAAIAFKGFDPWENISHAVEFNAAHALLKAREPVVKAAA